jgi:phage gp46-like protein
MINNNIYVDVDVKFDSTKGYFDIYWTNGDFGKIKGFDTAIKMSLMCERRASSSEISVPQLQRGWLGNLSNSIKNFEIGSKLWLLQQARATTNTLNKAITYASEALRWMIDDQLCTNINVTGVLNNSDIILNIQMIEGKNTIGSYTYSLWQNTFTNIT